MLVFAVWPQTSCHDELTRALVLAYVYRHWKWRNSARYECIYNITCWVYTPHSLFRQLIPPRLNYPVKIRSSGLIYTGQAECPCGQRETRRPSSGAQHVYTSVTSQYTSRDTIVTHTMDVDNRHGGSNYRCQAFSDKGQRIRQGQILLMLQPQRQRTVFLTISVFKFTSLLEWMVTKIKSVQIYCSRNCNELCYTFNACFLDDFLMHSDVEYQCFSPCE